MRRMIAVLLTLYTLACASPPSPRPTDTRAVTATSASPGAEVAERLERAWQSDRRAHVSDGELPAAIDAVMSHHLANGFFGERLDGMRRLSGFGPDRDLEVQLSPHRKAPEGQSDPSLTGGGRFQCRDNG